MVPVTQCVPGCSPSFIGNCPLGAVPVLPALLLLEFKVTAGLGH